MGEATVRCSAVPVFCFMGNWRHITGMQFPNRAAPVLVISAPCVDFARCKPLRADVCSSFIVERCGLTGKRETVKIVSTNSLSRRGRRNVPSASESVFVCGGVRQFFQSGGKTVCICHCGDEADESAGSASGTAPAGANEPRCRFDAGGGICLPGRPFSCGLFGGSSGPGQSDRGTDREYSAGGHVHFESLRGIYGSVAEGERTISAV